MSASVSVPYLSANISSAQVSSPYIFLSKAEVDEVNLAVYFHICASGIYLWDFLNNIRNDFRILTVHKLNFPTLVYFAVRITMLGYCLGRAVLLTAPVGDCGQLAQILNIMLTIGVIGETGMCYLRIFAVYRPFPYVVAFFALPWLAVVAMSLTLFKTFGAEHINQTNYCRENVQSVFAIPTIAVMLVNDLLIYLAICHRIYNIFLTYNFEANFHRKCVIILFGASLPIGSKVILLESQLYCLIIVISKVAVLALISQNKATNAKFFVMHLVLVTIIVSRVYRDLCEIDGQKFKPTTAYQTGNLTSAEFVHEISMAAQERTRISKKTMDITDDASSINTYTRISRKNHTPSLVPGAGPSCPSNSPRGGEDDQIAFPYGA